MYNMLLHRESDCVQTRYGHINKHHGINLPVMIKDLSNYNVYY